MAGKYNKHKQDGSHLGFPIWMILATVDLQVTSILPLNFKSIALSVQGKKFKTDFQDGHHSRNLRFPIATIWAIFDLQVTLMLPAKFRVNRPFSSEEVKKNRFSRWPPSWISNRNDVNYFYINKSSRCFLPIFKSTGPLVQENKWKKEFQDGRHDSHLGFPIQTIYPILDLQVTRMLPTKFRVKWPFSFSFQEKKRKIHFKDGCHRGHLGFLIGMILSIFDLQATLMLHT